MELEERSRSVVDQRRLLELEDQKRRAEEDKVRLRHNALFLQLWKHDCCSCVSFFLPAAWLSLCIRWLPFVPWKQGRGNL